MDGLHGNARVFVRPVETNEMRTSIAALQFSQSQEPAASMTEWDDFVASINNGHVFQSIRWAIYRQGLGWNPILLSWSKNSSQRAICLALHRSVVGLPVGGVLYVPRGPVLDYESSDAPYLLSEVLDKLVLIASRRFAVVRISPDVRQAATWVKELFMEKGFYQAKHPIQHTATIRLDLRKPLEQIITGMEKRRRSDVRKHERDTGDWSFHCGDSSHLLDTFHSMYHSTMLDATGVAKSLHEVRLMHRLLAPHHSSFIFIVEHQSRSVAGALIVAMGNRLWYLYGGSAKGDDGVSGAGVVLHWQIIKWAKERGYAEYDLQGIPENASPGDPLYGTYLFKRGWGGKVVRLLGEYDYPPYPFLGKLFEWHLTR